ncbi:MAG TPA: hypothetical protein VI277_00690 [Candidatus Limnocylindria bacterium]
MPRPRYWLVALAVVSAGCTGGLIPPDATPRSMPATAEACPGALLEGELLRDDASGFLVRHAEGFITPVAWPEGYSVREGERRELLDPGGSVAAREGDLVALGGGDDGAGVFVVCGPFAVTPQD